MPFIVIGIFVPCPRCGHNNKPHRRLKESLRLWLLDQLPPCKKCGAQLRKSDYFPPPGTPYVRMLEKELGLS